MPQPQGSKTAWYLARLRSMDFAEVLAHLRRRTRQARDRNGFPDVHHFGEARPFPVIPPRQSAPISLSAALEAEKDELSEGSWTGFNWLSLNVDIPPRWHKDYLAGVDAFTERCAFDLNHRHLPGKADVKLIWELSRWHPLLRLAMAAHVLDEPEAAYACLRLLESWVKKNRPFQGWNWTSALECGLRLIAFTWIDALVSPFADAHHLGARILPAHVYFTWRYRSFGSSANNHLLGELAGLIVSLARWPGLERWSVSPAVLRGLFEREILAQFHADGGTCEQALNYQLFSLEFCWQARAALQSLGLGFSDAVEERLACAAGFFKTVQNRGERWDYGDSDDAVVFPGYIRDDEVVDEWLEWLEKPEGGSLAYWLGAGPSSQVCKTQRPGAGWVYFPETGMALLNTNGWRLRWDLSPLGYLSTAAHGHLDALHVTLWFEDVCFVIDPGTGAYYGEQQLRATLASRAAHNGPNPALADFPRRLGPFLWSEHHAKPVLRTASDAMEAELIWQPGPLRRRILEQERGLRIEDSVGDGTVPFSCAWHFAPGTSITTVSLHEYVLERNGKTLRVQVDPAWSEVQLETNAICSPHFRQVSHSPRLVLRFAGHKPCVLGLSFIASRPHEDQYFRPGIRGGGDGGVSHSAGS